MKISSSFFTLAAAIPNKVSKNGKFVQDADAPRIACGGEITDDAIITSPGFDDRGHYVNNLDCTWEINIAGVSGFMIIPEFLEIEPHDQCVYDSLSINWEVEDEIQLGNETNSEEFNYKFCSPESVWDDFDEYTTSTPYPTTSTDYSTTTRTRFRPTTSSYYYPTSTSDYYSTSTSTQSTSTSYYDSSGSSWSTSAFPTSTSTEAQTTSTSYYDSSGSSWSTTAYPDSTWNPDMSNDSGRKRRAPVEGTLNSSGGDGRSSNTYIGDFTAPLYVSGNSGTIRFTSDYSVVMRGFKIRIEKGNSISPEGCDEIQFSSGTVSSPNFPENYGNNERCKYTLNADPGKMIKITFEKFDVEREGFCDFDALSISGRKHCGQNLEFGEKRMPMKTILINSDSTEVFWETDGSVVYGGFSFSWESVDNPITVASPPLASAAGFHDHMALFLSQLVYQMEFRRPHMTKALLRFWEKVQITEEYFQTSGTCDWSYSTPAYQNFEFKDFDESVTTCSNLRNFANNAKQFIENFVCMDEHEVPRRTFNRWLKMAENIERIADEQTARFCYGY